MLPIEENFKFVYNKNNALKKVQYEPTYNIKLNTIDKRLLSSISDVDYDIPLEYDIINKNGAILRNIQQKDAKEINSVVDLKGNLIIKMSIGLDIYHHEYIPNYHRSGWKFVLDALSLYQVKDKTKPHIIFDPYMDETFLSHINCTSSPYKSLGDTIYGWIGILHHPPIINLLDYPTNYDGNQVVNSTSFKISLKTCKGIIVLSNYLKKWLEKKLNIFGFSSIPVHVLYHPTEIVPIDKMFNATLFFNELPKNRYVVQIGGWLRNSYSIYELPIDNSKIQKGVLKGPNMDIYFKPKCIDFQALLKLCLCNDFIMQICCNCENICNFSGLNISTFCSGIKINLPDFNCLDYNLSEFGISKFNMSSIPNENKLFEPNKYIIGMIKHLERNDKSVKIIKYMNNNDYDIFLTKNIVFLNLINASACNTIIECIVRCTPIIINKIDPVVEYLGEDYPLYYKNIAEAAKLIYDLLDTKTGLLIKTILYLTNMNLYNKKLHIKTFLNDLSKILENLNLVNN